MVTVTALHGDFECNFIYIHKFSTIVVEVLTLHHRIMIGSYL